MPSRPSTSQRSGFILPAFDPRVLAQHRLAEELGRKQDEDIKRQQHQKLVDDRANRALDVSEENLLQRKLGNEIAAARESRAENDRVIASMERLNRDHQVPILLHALGALRQDDPELPTRILELRAKYQDAFDKDKKDNRAELSIQKFLDTPNVKKLQEHYAAAATVLPKGMESVLEHAAYDPKTGAFLYVAMDKLNTEVERARIRTARALLPNAAVAMNEHGGISAHEALPMDPNVKLAKEVAAEERRIRAEHNEKRIAAAARWRENMSEIHAMAAHPENFADVAKDKGFTGKNPAAAFVAARTADLYKQNEELRKVVESPAPPSDRTAPPTPRIKPAETVTPTKKPAVDTEMETFRKNLLTPQKPLSSAATESSAPSVIAADTDAADLTDRHTAAQQAAQNHADTLLNTSLTPEAVQQSADSLTTALSDGGMPKEEIDAVHESLNAGEVPDIQPHPEESRLTVVKSKTAAEAEPEEKSTNKEA